MKTIILTVALTVVVMWLVNFIVVVATDENEDIIYPFVCGIWYYITLVVVAIGNKCYKSYCKRKFNLYDFYGKDEKWVVSLCMTPKTATLFRTEGEFSIKLIRMGKDFKSAPYRQNILTKKKMEKNFHTSGFKAEYFKRFLK